MDERNQNEFNFLIGSSCLLPEIYISSFELNTEYLTLLLRIRTDICIIYLKFYWGVGMSS